MNKRTRILIADDEQTFLFSTAALLRKEGYACDCATDGITAKERLQSAKYDLLISDIKMNGNSELELIRDISRQCPWMAVILVTGYPSVGTAIRSIQLPVAAYLVKPFEFRELLDQIELALRGTGFYRAFQDLRRHVADWSKNLQEMGKTESLPHGMNSPSVMSSFMLLTIQKMADVLTDLKSCAQSLCPESSGQQRSHAQGFPPQFRAWRDTIKEAIELLERTKTAFKSKELHALRIRLEALIAGSASKPDLKKGHRGTPARNVKRLSTE